VVSIDEIVSAALRIGHNAKHAQGRSAVCADTLDKAAQSLMVVARGSRTGEDAVREVNGAARSVRASAERLSALSSVTQQFIQDIQK